MQTFYLAQLSSASVENRDMRVAPPLVGKLLLQIPDPAPDSEYVLYVVACSMQQHERNKELINVEELSKKKATELAATYRPARVFKRNGFLIEGRALVKTPAFDLEEFLQKLSADPT